MTKLKEIVKFLDIYLKKKDIKDYSRNGLQIKGKPEISKIAFAENASLDTFKMALKEKADLIVVHHGILWKTNNKKEFPYTKERINFLAKNNISIYAIHLPLDKHKISGNNAQLLKLLGAKIKKGFASHHKNKNISWIGELTKPVSVKEIVKKLNSKLKTKCKVLSFGPQKIKTIAVCSGGGGHVIFEEAMREKVDLYLTGDTIEIYTIAKDAKLNVIFAGHYATETLGVKALMEIVNKKFKVKTVFIDDPTGL